MTHTERDINHSLEHFGFSLGEGESLSRGALADVLRKAHQYAAESCPNDGPRRDLTELCYIRAALGWDEAQQGWRHVGENKPDESGNSPGGCPTLSE